MCPVINSQEIEVRLHQRSLHGDDVFQFRDKLQIEVRPARFETVQFALDTFEYHSVISIDLAQNIELLPKTGSFPKDFFQSIDFTFAGFPWKFPCKCRFVMRQYKRFRLALRDILPNFDMEMRSWPISSVMLKLKRSHLGQPR